VTASSRAHSPASTALPAWETMCCTLAVPWCLETLAVAAALIPPALDG
jgi:hypothetical protein